MRLHCLVPHAQMHIRDILGIDEENTSRYACDTDPELWHSQLVTHLHSLTCR